MNTKRVIVSVILGICAVSLAAALIAGVLFDRKRAETAETMANLALQPIQTQAEAEEPLEETRAANAATEEAAGEKEPEPAAQPAVYALFGVDTEEGDAGRSDCILLASLQGDRVKLCSLARDTLVTLTGRGVETKLGHAYAYGGPEEAMAAIRDSFGLDVQEYVTVNFSQMPQIVDLLGGAEVSLTQGEWDYLDLGQPYLGKTRLDGAQALDYCRIRSLDNDDGRTARQRTLVTALLDSLRTMPKGRLPELAAQGIQMCRTNVPLTELLRLGRELLGVRNALQVETLSIPGTAVNAWGGVRSDGVWYYVYDLDRAGAVLREFFCEAD